MSLSKLLGNQDAHVDLVDTAGARPSNYMRKTSFSPLNFLFNLKKGHFKSRTEVLTTF